MSPLCRSAYLVLLVCAVTASRDGMKTLSPDLVWWQKSLIYRVYPYTFQDSNNDGVGDLRGVVSRIPYFESLGVKALWLGPIFPYPRTHFGYSPSTFSDVDSLLGNLKDFQFMLEELHKKGIKVILDFPLGHTSKQHEWFQGSSSSQEGLFQNFYIWRDGYQSQDGNLLPPNNWMTMYNEPAWTWEEQRQQYYLHSGTDQQPLLNFNDGTLRKKIEEIFVIWLEREVDGFSISGLKDSFPTDTDLVVEHFHPADIYTNYWPDNLQLVRDWRKKFDFYANHTKVRPFLIINATQLSNRNLSDFYESGTDFLLNTNLFDIDRTCGGHCVHDLIQQSLDVLPDNAWPNFALGSPDFSRVASRKGRGFVKALNMMVLTLPGTAITYQGEELGLQNITIDYKHYDPWGRDNYKEMRTQYSSEAFQSPMQWSSEKNAGFSFAHNVWLPVHQNYKQCNVQQQSDDESGHSALQLYHKTAMSRRHPSFQNTNIQYGPVTRNIFSYIRHSGNEHDPGFLVALNVGSAASVKNYHEGFENQFFHKGEVLHNTGQIQEESLQVGQIVNLTKVRLRPGEGIVVRINKAKKR